jgi:threonine/homoserine/homoserine lactone efflux protein
VLNPKASLFFLALFSQIVSPETNIVIKSLYASEMIGMTILWFSIVAWMIDKNAVKRMYLASKHWIDRTM